MVSSPQTSYNERTLLETERPVYRDWKGDAGQDPMMSDVDYKARLEEGEPAQEAAVARPASTTGYQNWSQEELDLLTELVQKEGYSDWESKAKRLGTGRTGQAVRTRYERYSRALEQGTEAGRPARARSPSQAPPKRAAKPAAAAAAAGGAEPENLPSPGTRQRATEEWRKELARGDHVDARDKRNMWYESKIVAVKDGRVKIHFLGWSKKWDE